MNQTKNCGGCALYHSGQKICMRTRVQQEETDSCSSYTKELLHCDICGQPFIPPISYIMENDKIIVACGNCAGALGTCRTCKNSSYCDFQQNPIQIPPQIQQQIQKGPMTMVQTIINPARIAETCEKNCACWDPIDKACNRYDCGTCGKGYKPSYLP